MSVIESVDEAFTRLAEPFRDELLAYCYRMLGSIHDAEDLTQETMLRAWRSHDRYDPGRASMRTWLYRIATNVCLRALEQRRRRPLPSDLAPPAEGAMTPLDRAADTAWLQPIPDLLLRQPPDPAALAVQRDSLRLALIAALQHLPARQRVVFILREAMAWSAAEVAELLGGSTAAVNSALQRARAQLAAAAPSHEDGAGPLDERQRALVERYVRAFVSADLDSLNQLLHDDVTLEMPPYRTWFRGRAAVFGFMEAHLFATPGIWRVVPTAANRGPAAATYLRDPHGAFLAHSIQVLSTASSAVTAIVAFQDAKLFPLFDLPDRYAQP
ncbi:sigma-70 family RNA polymerase sigma factor [Nonomuraea sp. NPDC049695]|uniref:sigma-70 family RNA polymerase sigma factor n=1 Tax=Nonomuraea sp. NPDC049695 TaxID=3154734 RepID=UPI003447C3E2